jgi:branched-chain amino acid transport system substrate-binding protein
VQTRSLTKIAAIGVVGALALSGCGNSKSDDSKGLSGSASGSSNSASTYTVAFQGPLSGDNQQLGINEVNGVQLAVDQANKKKDLGFKVKLLKADDAGDPAKAPSAAAQVVQDKTVMGVIGPSFSGPTQAVGKTFGKAGISIVNPSASNGTLQTLGFPTWHRIFPNDFAEGPAAADWLAKKSKKVFVLNDLSPYGAGVASSVAKELKTKGVQVVAQGINAKETDLGPIAQTITNSGAGALFFGGYDAQGGILAKALVASNFKGVKMAGNGVKSSTFETGSGPAGNGWFFSCGCQDPTVAPSAKQFTADYTTAFNTPPSTYSPEAYDATNILINAIKAAKDAGSVTRQTVNEQVDKTHYDGITGTISFQSNGDIPQGAGTVNLFTQKNGKIVGLGDITKQS